MFITDRTPCGIVIKLEFYTTMNMNKLPLRTHLLGLIWLNQGLPCFQTGKDTSLSRALSQGTSLNNGDDFGIGLSGVKTPKECFIWDPDIRNLKIFKNCILDF